MSADLLAARLRCARADRWVRTCMRRALTHTGDGRFMDADLVRVADAIAERDLARGFLRAAAAAIGESAFTGETP